MKTIVLLLLVLLSSACSAQMAQPSACETYPVHALEDGAISCDAGASDSCIVPDGRECYCLPSGVYVCS